MGLGLKIRVRARVRAGLGPRARARPGLMPWARVPVRVSCPKTGEKKATVSFWGYPAAARPKIPLAPIHPPQKPAPELCLDRTTVLDWKVSKMEAGFGPREVT